MDDELIDEVFVNMEIWRLDDKKRKLDNRRMEQNQGDGNNG